MAEGDNVNELAEVSANNNVAAEDKSEAFIEKKNAAKDEIKEVEEESKEADEKDIENMDIDKEEVKENKADEEEKAVQDRKEAEEKPETKFEVMEEETAEKPEKDKEEVEDVANKQKEEKGSPQEHEVEKGSKESDKSGSGAQKKDRKRKRPEDKKKLEPKTPVAAKIERPVRQRKSVERLVASIEGEVTKEIHIEKGCGTALKDIPNVAYKLSKRMVDDTLKLLHTILFGRRGKAAQFKSNISQFSGFVWHENEEKQKMKVKEKLNKCVKENLLELCDVLDIPVAEETSRKEDLESQLMDFLIAPHPTTSELLAEKDQSSKGKKRERASKKSPSSTVGSLEGSTKSHKTEGASSKAEKKKKNVHEPKDDQEEGPDVMKANGVQERSDDEMSNQAESEEKDGKSEEESKKDKKKHRKSSNKSLSDKEPAGEVKSKKTPTKKTPSNSSKGSKKNDNNDANPKVYSKKKTTEVVKGKSSTGKKVLNGKGHKKADKLWPSDDELRSAICEVLKEVDFNTATFTDIVQILAKRYDTDLTPRKTSVKNMIQDELTRLADEADEEDEEENAEDDEKQPSVPGIEA